MVSHLKSDTKLQTYFHMVSMYYDLKSKNVMVLPPVVESYFTLCCPTTTVRMNFENYLKKSFWIDLIFAKQEFPCAVLKFFQFLRVYSHMEFPVTRTLCNNSSTTYHCHLNQANFYLSFKWHCRCLLLGLLWAFHTRSGLDSSHVCSHSILYLIIAVTKFLCYFW